MSKGKGVLVLPCSRSVAVVVVIVADDDGNAAFRLEVAFLVQQRTTLKLQ